MSKHVEAPDGREGGTYTTSSTTRPHATSRLPPATPQETRRERASPQRFEIPATTGPSRLLKNIYLFPYRFSKRLDRMPVMGNRSQMRKFKRRRRAAGLVLLMSLAIIVLGVALFFRTDPLQRTSAAAVVERVAVPMISEAPQAVAEQEPKETAGTQAPQNDAAKEGADKQQPETQQAV